MPIMPLLLSTRVSPVLAAVSRFDLGRVSQHPVLFGSLVAMALLMLVLALVGKVPLAYNLRNLMVRWTTTLLMLVAFFLVVLLLIGMLAFVNGLDALTNNSGQPGNVVVFSSGANDEGFSNLALNEVSNVERMEGIAVDEKGQRIVSKEVFVIVNREIPTPPGAPPRRQFVQLRGIEDPQIAAFVHGLKLKQGGQWFSEAGVEEATDGPAGQSQVLRQCVLGNGIAGELGKDRPGGQPLAVGDQFDMADRVWKVVGILDSTGSTFDSEVWAKRQIVGEGFGKESSYSSFVIRAADVNKAAELAKTLKDSKEVALNAMTEQDYFQSLSETSRVLLYAVWVVVVFVALGGVFGVMNTMFAAISQRIKDIGVLRMLGYSSGHVLMSFLLESLVLSLVGGLLGCALGMFLDGLTAKSTVGGQGAAKTVVLQFVVSQEVLATGLLLSLLMGLIGGLLPALRAMTMRVLETLR
ncbi:MAG TPA: ABC transporter permease [Planctomycetaceae bacterium]|nr:ABC transporter permease [Planctomycetaceae bacterium]